MPHAQNEGTTATRCTCEVVVDRTDMPLGGRRVAKVQLNNRVTLFAVRDIDPEIAREMSEVLTSDAREHCNGKCQTSRASAAARHLLAV